MACCSGIEALSGGGARRARRARHGRRGGDKTNRRHRRAGRGDETGGGCVCVELENKTKYKNPHVN